MSYPLSNSLRPHRKPGTWEKALKWSYLLAPLPLNYSGSSGFPVGRVKE